MFAIVGTPTTFAFTDGGSGHVCDLGSAPEVGQIDVLTVNSNTTVSTPTGFTLDETAVTNQGAYVFRRKATGGEGSTVSVTTSGNHHTIVGWSRWNGGNAHDSAGATSTQANSSLGSSTPTHATGTLGETNELVIALGALHSIGPADQNTPVWSAGYTALTSAIQGSSNSGVVQFSAYKTGAGTAAEAPQVSWSGTGAFNRYMLTTAITMAAEISASAAITLPALAGTGTATVSGTETASGGSWETLLIISREARALARENRQLAARPMSCPLCGEPLRQGPRGILFCPADGWRPR